MEDLIIRQYLNGLELGDYSSIMKLFSKGAIVHSPLYGKIKATKFYQDLFADTSKSKITPLAVFKGKNSAAAHFRYVWYLADGVKVNFECVDIFKFSKSGLIKDLTIIYDTHKTRPRFEKMNVQR
ncbi:nuclear transport factor 2 family protein [Candidatus Micrarchaeota archaeon]|nr:nuclear transport factor 2 family protein [Candidatus Micrarchaeota archaeon]